MLTLWKKVKHMPRLLSCTCGPASAWLDTLLLTWALELKSGEVKPRLQHRLGIPVCLTVQCESGANFCRTDAEHSMRFPVLAAQTTMWHDIQKGILHRIVHKARIASTREPALHQLPGLVRGTSNSADGSGICAWARRDILLALTHGITIAGVSVMHPISSQLPQPLQEQPHRTNRSGLRVRERSLMAKTSCLSLWRAMGA
jgi:hypothetical protein